MAATSDPTMAMARARATMCDNRAVASNGAGASATAVASLAVPEVDGVAAAAQGHHQYNAVHFGDLLKKREPTQSLSKNQPSTGLELLA